jgi:hypothetical protein
MLFLLVVVLLAQPSPRRGGFVVLTKLIGGRDVTSLGRSLCPKAKGLPHIIIGKVSRLVLAGGIPGGSVNSGFDHHAASTVLGAAWRAKTGHLIKNE